MAYALYPTQPVTFSGDPRVKFFRGMALQRLDNLVTEASFNKLDQLQRRIEVSPGFVIFVGLAFGTQFAHVYLAPEVADFVVKTFLAPARPASSRTAQKIVINSLTWTAGEGNPAFPRSDSDLFLIGDTAVMVLTGGNSGNPITVTSSNTSLGFVDSITHTVGATYSVQFSILNEGAFILTAKQAGNVLFAAAPNFNIGFSSDNTKPVINPIGVQKVCYECNVRFAPTATLKRGGDLTWSIAGYDGKLANLNFEYTQDTPPQLVIKAKSIQNAWYGFTWVTIIAHETANGVQKDSDPYTVVLQFAEPLPLRWEKWSITDIRVDGGVPPYSWGFLGTMRSLNFLYGWPGIEGTHVNRVNASAGGCGSYVRVIDSISNVLDIPLSQYSIPQCTAGTPLTATITNKGQLHITGGTQLPGGGYKADITPSNSTGGVRIWAVSVHDVGVTSASGCYCQGAGITVTDGAGNTVFTPFSSAFGPAVLCSSGCGMVSGGGGSTSGSSWQEVYNGANSSCAWVAASAETEFGGFNTYQTLSADGKFYLKWGYSDSSYDGKDCYWPSTIHAGNYTYDYSWGGMNDSFYLWCAENDKLEIYRELGPEDFGLIEAWKLPAGVQHHIIELWVIV